MTHTILTIISDELSHRLGQYKTLIATAAESGREELRAELNHRYLCLQMAYYMAGGMRQPPAITKEQEAVHEELARWSREIQRNSTRETAIADGRRVAIITEFLEETKPIIAHQAQLNLL
jgi:phenylacetate-coenzyme A ligase PaaK-like adenylate-forming protein